MSRGKYIKENKREEEKKKVSPSLPTVGSAASKLADSWNALPKSEPVKVSASDFAKANSTSSSLLNAPRLGSLLQPSYFKNGKPTAQDDLDYLRKSGRVATSDALLNLFNQPDVYQNQSALQSLAQTTRTEAANAQLMDRWQPQMAKGPTGRPLDDVLLDRFAEDKAKGKPLNAASAALNDVLTTRKYTRDWTGSLASNPNYGKEKQVGNAMSRAYINNMTEDQWRKTSDKIVKDYLEKTTAVKDKPQTSAEAALKKAQETDARIAHEQWGSLAQSEKDKYLGGEYEFAVARSNERRAKYDADTKAYEEAQHVLAQPGTDLMGYADWRQSQEGQNVALLLNTVKSNQMAAQQYAGMFSSVTDDSEADLKNYYNQQRRAAAQATVDAYQAEYQLIPDQNQEAANKARAAKWRGDTAAATDVVASLAIGGQEIASVRAWNTRVQDLRAQHDALLEQKAQADRTGYGGNMIDNAKRKDDLDDLIAINENDQKLMYYTAAVYEPDFLARSSVNEAVEDDTYRFIMGLENRFSRFEAGAERLARSQGSVAAIGDRVTELMRLRDYMTDSQKQIYAYLMNKDPAQARDYLDKVENMAIFNQYQAKTAERAAYTRSGVREGVWANIEAGLNIGQRFAESVSGGLRGLAGLEDNPYDWNQNEQTFSTQSVREATNAAIDEMKSDFWRPVVKTVYNAGTSGLDSTLSTGIGMLLGGPLGMTAATQIGISVQSAQAARQRYLSEIREGHGQTAATIVGVTAGAVEQLTETIGAEWAIGAMFGSAKKGKNLASTIWSGLWRQSLAEGGEELMGAPVALAMDNMINGADSQVNRRANELAKENPGWSKAQCELHAYLEWMGETGVEAISAALSAGGSTVIRAGAVTATAGTRANTQVNQIAERVEAQTGTPLTAEERQTLHDGILERIVSNDLNTPANEEKIQQAEDLLQRKGDEAMAATLTNDAEAYYDSLGLADTQQRVEELTGETEETGPSAAEAASPQQAEENENRPAQEPQALDVEARQKADAAKAALEENERKLAEAKQRAREARERAREAETNPNGTAEMVQLAESQAAAAEREAQQLTQEHKALDAEAKRTEQEALKAAKEQTKQQRENAAQTGTSAVAAASPQQAGANGNQTAATAGARSDSSARKQGGVMSKADYSEYVLWKNGLREVSPERAEQLEEMVARSEELMNHRSFGAKATVGGAAVTVENLTKAGGKANAMVEITQNGEKKTVPLSEVTFSNPQIAEAYERASAYQDLQAARRFLGGFETTTMPAASYGRVFSGIYAAARNNQRMTETEAAWAKRLHPRLVRLIQDSGRERFTQDEAAIGMDKNTRESFDRSLRTVPTAEKAPKGYKGLTLDFDTQKAGRLTDHKRVELEILDRLAKKRGLQITVTDQVMETTAGNRINGSYDPKSNRILINLDAMEGGLVSTAFHEAWHAVREAARNNEALRSQVEDFEAQIVSYLERDESFDMDDRIAEVIDTYRQAGQELTEDEAREEIIANALMGIADSGVQQELADIARDHQTVIEKITDFLKNLIRDITETVKRVTGHNTEARALRTQTEGRHVEVGGQVMDAANFLNHYYEALTSAAMQIRENQNQENLRVTEENQAENENNTQESAEDAGNTRYSFMGTDPETGRSVYMSNFAPNTPAQVKANRIIDLIQKVWSKNPIPLTVMDNGVARRIEARFDPDFDPTGARKTDVGKMAYGLRIGSRKERRVMMNLADDYVEILKESRYYNTENERKANEHPGVIQWHYFVDNIYYVEQGSDIAEPYLIEINIKEKANGDFVYSFAAHQDETGETKKVSATDLNARQQPRNGAGSASPSNGILARGTKNNNSQNGNSGNGAPMHTPNQRFSLEEPIEQVRDLVAVHNVDEDGLRSALELGGFPSPSIAVVRSGQGHSMYGPVSVVFRSGTIDPQRNSRNRLYGADAWTPTKEAAPVARRLDDDLLRSARDRTETALNGLEDEYKREASRWYNQRMGNDSTQETLDDWETSAYYNLGMLAAYQRAHGANVETVRRAEKVNGGWNESREQEYVDFFNVLLGNNVSDQFLEDAENLSYNELLNKYADYFAQSGERAAKLKEYMDAGDFRGRRGIYNRMMETYRYVTGGGQSAPTQMVADYDETKNDLQRKIKRSDFRQWLDQEIGGAFGEKGVRNEKDQFTQTGRRRTFNQLYDEYNLANIVKAMNKANAKGGQAGGATGIIATAAKEYGSIDEMRGDQARLQNMPQEDYNRLVQDLDSQINLFTNNTIGNQSGYMLGTLMPDAARAYAKTGKLTSIADTYQKQGVRLEPRQVQQLGQIFQQAQNIPTGYFEAKPQRGVGFDEVAFVLLPADMQGGDIAASLEDKGIETRFYDGDTYGEDGQRTKALNDALDSEGNVRFSLDTPAERMAFEADRAIRNAGYAAPDGIRYSLAGPLAENGVGGQVKTAQRMAAEGYSDAEIEEKTGCVRGYNGNFWAILYSDDWSVRDSDTSITRVGDILDASDLYKAYPDIKTLGVFFERMNDSIAGSYDSAGAISLDYKLKRGNPDMLKEVLLHEIQHAIQHMEGRNTGASVAKWQKIQTAYERENERVQYVLNGLTNKYTDLLERVYGHTRSEMRDAGLPFSLGWLTDEQLENVLAEAETGDRREIRKDTDFLKKYRRINPRHRGPGDLYYNTVGEIEARQAQKGMEGLPEGNISDNPYENAVAVEDYFQDGEVKFSLDTPAERMAFDEETLEGAEDFRLSMEEPDAAWEAKVFALEADNKRFRELTAQLAAELNEWEERSGKLMTHKNLETLARNLKKQTHATNSIKSITHDLNWAYELLTTADSPAKAQTAIEALGTVARSIVESGQILQTDVKLEGMQDEIREARGSIKRMSLGTKKQQRWNEVKRRWEWVPMSRIYKEEFAGDLQSWRANYAGRVATGRGEVCDIETVYSELCYTCPSFFQDMDGKTMSEMWEDMMRFMDATEPKRVNPNALNERYQESEDVLNASTNGVLIQLLQAYAGSGEAKDTSPVSSRKARAVNDLVQKVDDLFRTAQQDERVPHMDGMSRGEYEKQLDQMREKMRAWQQEQRAKNRERVDQAVQRTREHMQEVQQRRDERREATEAKNKLRGEITRKQASLTKKLNNPNSQGYVPIKMQQAVTHLLEALQFDETAEDGANVLSREALLAAKDAYMSINKEGAGEEARGPMAAYYNGDLESSFDRLLETAVSKRARDLDQTELENLRDIVAGFAAAVINEDRVFSDARKESLREMGGAMIRESQERARTYGEKKTQGALQEFMLNGLSQGLLKPVTVFERFKGTELGEIYEKALRPAEWKHIRNVQQAGDYLDSMLDKYNQHESVDKDSPRYRKERSRSFTLSSGRTISLTDQELMTLYAWQKREQRMKTNHLLGGGIKLANAQRGESMQEYKLSKADLAAFNDALTDEQKGYVDEMVSYLSGQAAEWGNEVTRELYGIEKFTEKYYMPFTVAKNYVASNPAQAQDQRIKTASFTKNLTEKASTVLELKSFTEMWCAHVEQMSDFNAFTLPMEDMVRLMNYKEGIYDEEGNFVGTGETLRPLMQRAWGNQTVSYIHDFLTRLNGNSRSEHGGNWLNALMGKAKGSAVTFNLSVAFQQAGAGVRAMAEMNPADVMKGLAQGAAGFRKNFRELQQWAPIAVEKDWGYFDTNMRRGLYDRSKRSSLKVNQMEWLNDKGGALAGMGDEFNWSQIWSACKAETKRLHPELTGDAFYQRAADRFTEVIDKTQVVDSIFQRSQWATEKGMMRNVMSFMSEPVTMYNMVYRGVVNLSDAIKSGDKAARSKAIGAMVKTSVAILCSAALTAALKSAVTGLRDRDNEKKDEEGNITGVRTYWDKARDSWASNMWDNLLGVGSIYVKMYQDATSGFGSSDLTTSWLTNLSRGIKELGKGAEADFEKAGYYIAQGISSLTGVGFGGLWRDTKAIYKTAEEILNAENLAGTAWDQSKPLETRLAAAVKNYAYSAEYKKAHPGTKTNSGFYSDMLVAEYLKNGFSEDYKKIADAAISVGATSQGLESSFKTKLRKAEERIPAAAKALNDGDLETYNRLMQELSEAGIGSKALNSMVKSEYNALQPKEEEDPGTGGDLVEQLQLSDKKTTSLATSVATSYLTPDSTKDDVVKAVRLMKQDGLDKDAIGKKLSAEYKKAYAAAVFDGNTTEAKRLLDLMTVEGSGLTRKEIMEWPTEMAYSGDLGIYTMIISGDSAGAKKRLQWLYRSAGNQKDVNKKIEAWVKSSAKKRQDYNETTVRKVLRDMGYSQATIESLINPPKSTKKGK